MLDVPRGQLVLASLRVIFGSVQDSIEALSRACMCAPPLLRNSPGIAFEMVPVLA